MQPPKEIEESASPSYGRYEGNQIYADQPGASSYERAQSADSLAKVYPLPPERKNLFRFLLVVLAMVTILVLAGICLLLVGGTGGWVSFIAVSFIVFLISVVALDKIQ
jgi:hypothetical protein